MNTDSENPTFLYRLIDRWGNNLMFSFIYMNYIKTLPIKGDETILDFGSGSGAGSRHLAKILKEKGGKLYCVDISAYWMKIAQKRLRNFNNIKFLTGQLYDLNIKNKSFDIVYVFYALHHVKPDLRDMIVKEFARLLKDNGQIFIKEPQRKNDGMPVSEIIDLMTKNGFKEKESIKNKATFTGIFVKVTR